MLRHKRSRLGLIVLLAVGLLMPVGGAATVATADSRFPDRIELPNGFRPEGIAIGRKAKAWLGSLANGDIYEVSLRTGEGEVISEGPGTPSVGMKVDKRGRLFVAGGPAGDARVVSTRSGDVLASYDFADGNTFINDVVLTKRYAWFTDSMNAVLYGVPLGRRLADQDDVVTLPLGGEWEQVAGEFNANGIEETRDHESLLVIQSFTGFLFRVDPDDGEAERVDLEDDELLTAGDGLLRHGKTLYVVQNQLNQVAVVELDRDGEEGEIDDTLTSPHFDVPTTAARFKKHLYLPNARFNTLPTPDTPYSVTRIRR